MTVWHKYPEEKPSKPGKYLICYKRFHDTEADYAADYWDDTYSAKSWLYFMNEDVKGWAEIDKMEGA